MYKKIILWIVMSILLSGCSNEKIESNFPADEITESEPVEESVEVPEDLNSEQLIDFLNNSKKYTDILFGSGCNYIDYEDTAIVNDNEYYKVTLNGTSNINDIKNILMEYYTEEAVDIGLDLNNNSDYPRYVDVDGDLYSCGLGIGGVGREIFRLEAKRVGDFEYTLDIHLAKMNLDDSYDYDNPIIEHYNIFYIDNGWKFDHYVNIANDGWGKCSVSMSTTSYN